MATTTLIRSAVILALCTLVLPAASAAQDSPLSHHNRWMYAGVKVIILRSAEKMPETDYSFRPTAVVRSFGEIIAHVTEWQYKYCAPVLGEQNPFVADKTKTSKTDRIAALTAAFAYCDRAYDGLTDVTGVELVKLGMPMPKLGVLNINNLHSTEHYGNLVTYLRMKDIVPPSSEPNFVVMPPKR